MKSLPPALVVEIRHAFRSYSRQHAASRTAGFTTFYHRLKSSKPTSRDKNVPIQVIHRQLQAQKRDDAEPPLPTAPPSPESKQLVPRKEKDKALDSGRKVPVPFKVIPKADIAPNLTLSPKERLHIEQLTRRLPPRREPKVYKKKVRIYTAGTGWIYTITLLRFIPILGLTFFTLIVAPANWVNGSSLWVVAGICLASFVPVAVANWFLRPMITEVFLRLPPSAQGSPKAVMAYAKSLPADAVLELTFQRWTTIADTVAMRIANTRPAANPLRPVKFEANGPLVNRGSFLRPNPTQFYVQPYSGKGKAARDVTPGIWGEVFRRLTGVESGAVSKWRR